MSGASPTVPEVSVAASDFAIDTEQLSLKAQFARWIARLRAGDLGMVPSVGAIVLLTAFFTLATSDDGTFWNTRNFANLLSQSGSIIVLSMAITFVLLLGEIDLSAGYSAGIVAALLATQLRDGRPLLVVIALCLLAAIALGLFTGFLVAKVGIPSFIVTLANFLSFQGIVLLITTEGGSIGIENQTVLAIDKDNMSVALSWILGLVAVALFAAFTLQRAMASRGTVPMSGALLQVGGATVIAVLLLWKLTQNRAFASATKEIKGVPYTLPIVLALLVLLTFLLNRTAWGRHLYAVGGNAEAARRAGINVARIKMSAFVMCAVLAGIGGFMIASRQGGANPQIGGGDTVLLAVGAAVVGGTSLFGGRGRIVNSVLGGLVFGIINNGLPLVGKRAFFGTDIDFSKSGIKFIVNGLVLLLAASVDALARKRKS